MAPQGAHVVSDTPAEADLRATIKDAIALLEDPSHTTTQRISRALKRLRLGLSTSSMNSASARSPEWRSDS